MMAGILAASAQAGGAKHAAKDYGRAIPVPLSRAHVPGIYQQCSMVRSEGGEAKLTFAVSESARLRAGSSYTVVLDVTPANCATNVKPTQVKITVKVMK